MFEKYIRNAITDRYNLICSIDAHEKQHPLSVYDSSSGGGNTIPQNSTTAALASMSATFDFMYFWIKCLDNNEQA